MNVTADAPLYAVATCILSARRIGDPMIKRIRPDTPSVAREEWRNLDDEVEVELTSEDPDWPIERALLGQATSGWRAKAPGPQTIRLAWPAPISIRRIRLVFEERSHARTQEFVVRAATSDGEREIVRQQFTFSPPGTTVQREEYATNLDGVSRLELAIAPPILFARLPGLRLAGAPGYRDAFHFHGLAALRVEWV